jgi:very-short-patch-repair endonuclease
MRGADGFKTDRARRFRGASTNVEGVLWYRLRGRRLNGYKFVRQAPIGPYVVDFICRECRLIVEVDGGRHADSQSDAVRDKWPADRNYRVLRFWNSDVSRNLAGVLETIATALAESSPHPDRRGDPASPRARGEAKVASITI